MSEADGISADKLASLNISDVTYNRDYVSGVTTNVAYCDFVVLQSDGSRTANLNMVNVLPYNCRYMIRDDVTGRKIANNAGSYLQARVPICYEGYHSWPERSRLIIGDFAS